MFGSFLLTAENTEVSTNYLVRKVCGNSVETVHFHKTVHFHIIFALGKRGKITVFYAGAFNILSFQQTFP